MAVAGSHRDALPSIRTSWSCAVSAMGKTTDQLIEMARGVSASPQGREFDLLLAAGEQIAVSMVGAGAAGRGVPAVSLTAIAVWHPHRRLVQQGARPQRGNGPAGGGTGSRQGRHRRRIPRRDQQRRHHDARPRRRRYHRRRPGGGAAGHVYENCTDVDGVYTADPGWCRMPGRSPNSVTRNASNWPRRGPKSSIRARPKSACSSIYPIHVRSAFPASAGDVDARRSPDDGTPSVVGVTTDRRSPRSRSSTSRISPASPPTSSATWPTRRSTCA